MILIETSSLIPLLSWTATANWTFDLYIWRENNH